tara:strand:+ start:921 stop:1130 length:210 start_codon:yes stop_codon:yes gene_type:complete
MKTVFLTVDKKAKLLEGLNANNKKAIELVFIELDRLEDRIRGYELVNNLTLNEINNKAYKLPDKGFSEL